MFSSTRCTSLTRVWRLSHVWWCFACIQCALLSYFQIALLIWTHSQTNITMLFSAMQLRIQWNISKQMVFFVSLVFARRMTTAILQRKKHNDNDDDNENDDGISHANTCSAPKFNLMIEIAMIVICFDANLRNCTMNIQIHSNLSFASTIGGFFFAFDSFFSFWSSVSMGSNLGHSEFE